MNFLWSKKSDERDYAKVLVLYTGGTIGMKKQVNGGKSLPFFE